MMQIMKHRGPDDEGVFIKGNVGLGFVRLSIIDLSSAGNQPMFSDDNRYVMVFNGEIYNYIEIRAELQKKGYRFKTQTDSEVLLTSYIEWGEACLHKFNGMWAFCIYDTLEKHLFFARDRYGVKPFYYYFDHEKFFFASEIPPILSCMKGKLDPNDQAIFDFLVYNRSDHIDTTFFKGVYKLLHGHSINLNLNCFKSAQKVDIHKWYDLHEKVTKSNGFNDFSEYQELFSSAVGIRLRSDVPLGTCFSGGLDSSSIVSTVMHTFKKQDINTFSAIYGKNLPGDEQHYISIYKNQLTNMHFVQPTIDSLLADLDNLILTHSEPFPSTSIYAGYEVMRLAKKHVTVVLDGQGADEQLAGYHYFFSFFFKELIKSGNITKAASEMIYYLVNHKSSYALKTLLFLFLPTNFKTVVRINSNLRKSFTSKFGFSNIIPSNLYNSTSLKNALLNHFEFKLEHLLKWEDVNSMRFSVESRTPFLDYRLVEKTLATSSNYIIDKGSTKVILRRAMTSILPYKIVNRQSKVGFSTPETIWLRDQRFKKLYYNELNTNKFFLNKYFVLQNLDKLYIDFMNGNYILSKEIWKVFNLSLWYKVYFCK